MLGASIYLKSIDENYISILKKNNVTSIFTSLHIKEEKLTQEEIVDAVSKLIGEGFDLIIDISPDTLKILKIADYLELKELGVKTVRLDYGFDDIGLIKELYANYKLVFNASIIDEPFIQKLLDNGIDLDSLGVMHNFYPKMNSGLSSNKLIQKNELFKKYNLNVIAFVAGDSVLRYPTYEGLVTLEKHRGVHSYVSGLDLYHNHYVTSVFVGDGRSSDNALSLLNTIGKNTLYVEAVLYDENFYETDFRIRKDSNDRVIRLNTRSESSVLQGKVLTRQRGAISITNSLYGRYNGEVELYNADEACFDARYNTIGYVMPNFYDVMNYADKYEVIKFIRPR